KWFELIRRLCRSAETNGRSDAIAQFQVSGDEIGMKMRQEYVLDLQPMLGGEGHVLVDVALRINDDASTRCFISDYVGSVRQTRQIELFEDHGVNLLSHYYLAPASTIIHAEIQDRKSTRLNSSHSQISYAVFCL